jgi:tetratricopeptide (TPR) repeat protein
MRQVRPIPLILLIALSAGPVAAADTFAVLPLFNPSNQSNLDWIGESVAETIRESLNSEGFLALSREDRVEVFRRLSIKPGAVLTTASVIKAGESLDAGEVIYGDFESKTSAAGEKTIRLTIRMINLKRFKESGQFEQVGAVEDLSLLETKLAWQLIKQLGPKSAETEEEFLKARPPVRIDAVELYIRGLLSSVTDQKQKMFTQAAALDPRYSQPAFQLGLIYWDKKDYKNAGQWLEHVTKADSHYMESLFLHGLCKYNEGEYLEAIKDFQTVAAEVPLNEVYNNLGAAQSRDEIYGAEINFTKALQGDEADPDYWFNMGYLEWKGGAFFQAADKFRAVLDRSPEDVEAKTFLGRCLAKEGQKPGDTKTEGRERLKYLFEDSAFRQLQAEMKR